MEPQNLIVIKCPQCGLRLSFKPVANYRQKPVTCPRCKFVDLAGNFIIVQDPAKPSAAASNIQQNAPKEQDTKPFDNGNDDQTKLQNTAVVKLKCVTTGQTATLAHGANTVGRKCENPKAKILFEDKSGFMSRHHCTITVIGNTGNPQIQLADEKSTNGIFINGHRVPDKTIVKITPGVRFKMGDMEFTCEVINPNARKATPPPMPRKQNTYDTDDTTL